MSGQLVVYKALTDLGIPYETVDHEPAFTVEDMDRLTFPPDVVIAKNLFLRDAKGRRHFLVVLRKERMADLRDLEGKIGATRLSFASEDRLAKYLGVTKGSVAPFGILNDADRAVEVVFDRSLEQCGRVGVHPNDNSATLLLTFADVLRVVREHGNQTHFID